MIELILRWQVMVAALEQLVTHSAAASTILQFGVPSLVGLLHDIGQVELGGGKMKRRDILRQQYRGMSRRSELVEVW